MRPMLSRTPPKLLSAGFADSREKLGDPMTNTPIHPDRFHWYDYKYYSFFLGPKLSVGRICPAIRLPRSASNQAHGGMVEQIHATLRCKHPGRRWPRYGDVARIVEYVRPEGIHRYADPAAVRRSCLATISQ
ncbi:protein of unknown function [Bradyrhizobium vignae]|uniref:Uncharacterized protein n=1 Tax=Bradyrhizobium vignae TaxID=1549949 RepID=A0A2U3QA73_9BRAD|nr:protein of unknown function [Bradyrhizobium vignae]